MTQVRHRANDSRELEDLQYELVGNISKKRQALNTVTSLQTQLQTVGSVVEGYCRHLPEETELFTADFTNNFSVLLYDVS